MVNTEHVPTWSAARLHAGGRLRVQAWLSVLVGPAGQRAAPEDVGRIAHVAAVVVAGALALRVVPATCAVAVAPVGDVGAAGLEAWG